jgi:tripartite-type tricarboxylate transporter receptor subunit TctC
MKKGYALILFVFLFLAAFCISASAADFPAKNINGVVQWGAGGGTDSLMRPLAALAEQKLGVSVVIQNMTGATGSIATQFVYDAPADGYTLLMGAENPALYKALGISQLTYEDFDCVFLIGDETVGVIVSAKSPYKSFKEIIEAAKAKPGKLKISTTGKGGLPWEMGAFISDVTGATFNQIPYDSDASAKTAVMSGECDFTVCKVQSGIEDYRAGKIKFLTMMALAPVKTMPEVPLVTAEYPDFAKYLPWGPYYGIFVKKGTDPAATKKLSDAFASVASDPSYQKVLSNFNINFLGYSGAKAQEYIANWQKNTVGALTNSGALK